MTSCDLLSDLQRSSDPQPESILSDLPRSYNQANHQPESILSDLSSLTQQVGQLPGDLSTEVGKVGGGQGDLLGSSDGGAALAAAKNIPSR